MPAVIEPSKIDNLIKLYASGMSIAQCAQSIGVNPKTADKYIRQSGVQLRTKAESARLAGAAARGVPRPTLRKPMPGDVIALYSGGMSLKDIAARYGKCRKDVARYLRSQGVHVDGQSTRDKKFGREGIREWALKASHSATLTPTDFQKVAAGKSRTKGCAGAMEKDFCDYFRRNGLDVFHQFPVGTYNLDIAMEELKIAVEIERGSWYLGHGNNGMSTKPGRLKYLFNLGWRVIFVRVGRSGAPVNVAAIGDKIIALAEVFREYPSAPGQYGVINRNGEPVSRLPDYLDCWTRIPGF